ncbi:MAG: DUF4198 domain-containing protein [Proteobacteria bacterium]|nr:DUF4198 domain-containing protein [Pseudomonadota bacterium]
MKKYHLISAALCLLALLAVSNSVFAHYVSVTTDNYHPQTGEEVTIQIGWGHKFPGDGEMRKEGYQHTNIEIIDPMGAKKSIAILPREEKGNEPIKVKFAEQGVYTILISQKQFSTKTAKGYKYLPKDQLDHVIHSRWSETVSKTIVNAGPVDLSFNSSKTDTTDRFQIIPLKNPLMLEKGEILPVKVTLDGEPWGGMVCATYAGFSDMEDTFAYTTKADKEGIARIKILEKGLWLIKADHAYPYEDPKKADEYSLKVTLTFNNN